VQAVAVYRDKNKKLADPNASKGGLFSLGNKLNQKVRPSPHTLPTPLSIPPLHALTLTLTLLCTHQHQVLPTSGEGQDLLDRVQNEADLEASPALAGMDVDDEILIPELAKKVQSNHDEIDKQLIDQREMLAGLQVTPPPAPTPWHSLCRFRRTLSSLCTLPFSSLYSLSLSISLS